MSYDGAGFDHRTMGSVLMASLICRSGAYKSKREDEDDEEEDDDDDY